MAAIAEIATASAEELAPLLGENITSVVPFTSGISELESLEGALGSGFGVQELIESSIKPLSKTLGVTAAAYATLQKTNLKGSKMPQTIKVQHEVKRSHYGGSRRYKSGKRTKVSRRRRKHSRTNAVKSFNSYTSASALSGSSSRSSKYSILSRTYLPEAIALQGGGTLTGAINNDFLNNSTGAGGYGYKFNLADFTNYTDFTAMYRFYKILWVKVIFYPEQNCHVAAKANEGTAATMAYDQVAYADGTSTRTGRAPTICYAPDQTSSDGFSSFEVAMAHDRAKFHMFNDSRELSVFLVPTIRDKVGATSGSTGPAKPKWISTEYPNEEHYGLRCYSEGFHNSNFVKVLCTMKVAFRDLKH
jgi:hypothetical protein